MKLKYTIFISAIALMLCGCKDVEPEQTPAEEYYLRNFIKTFGLIDPNQNWNLSEATKVTVRLDRDAHKVLVYANIMGRYYRVARCMDVPQGVITIPIDIPKITTDLVIDIDGKSYMTLPDEKVDVRSNAPMSRAGGDLDENNDLGYLIVSEDLGSTDDVDFNDFIARFSYYENSYKFYGELTPDDWDKIDQDISDTDLGKVDEPVVPRTRAGENGNTILSIKAVAAGGILPIYLHYRNTDAGTDYIIGSNVQNQTRNVSAEEAASTYEWHRWFGTEIGMMVNTGNGSVGPILGAETTFEVPAGFTFTDYSSMTYEAANPTKEFNFNFNQRQIKGFYITVDTHSVGTLNSSDEGLSYDVGRAIGHTRNTGLPPQMFLIPDLCSLDGGTTVENHFLWATERTQIDDAYNGFDDWVSKMTDGWYNNANNANVVTNEYVRRIYGD